MQRADSDARRRAPDDRPTVAVTGASGYLGSRFVDHFARDGWAVVRLVRSPQDDPRARPYDLGSPLSPDLLADVDVLVHAAYDLTVTRREDVWRVNVEGSRRLLAAAADCGVARVITISSMSAYDGTTQVYGRAKLAIESSTLATGGCVVRPGLVYGEDSGGMAGTLERLARLPVVPLVGRGAHQFPVREADLVEAIATLASTPDFRSEVLGVASEVPVSFADLLRTFAGEGRHPHFIPIPWQALYWPLRTLEAARVPLPFRADSLLGLVRPAPSVPGVERLHALGIHAAPFEAVAS